MNGEPSSVAIYPKHCFHLSPTLNKWCPLTAADIQALTRLADFESQNVFFYLNHPIRWVRVVGVVVACSAYYGRHIYTVDDGSGQTVECVERPEGGVSGAAGVSEGSGGPGGPGRLGVSGTAAPRFRTGDVVAAKGELRLFREALQVYVAQEGRGQLVRLGSTEEEVRFWAKVRAFAADVLARPWTLSEAAVRQCREAVEGGGGSGGSGSVTTEGPRKKPSDRIDQVERVEPTAVSPGASRRPLAQKRWNLGADPAVVPERKKPRPPKPKRWCLNPED